MNEALNEMKNYISILSKISKTPELNDNVISDSMISDIEERVGGELPPSYKLFLQKFGNLILPGKWIYGVDYDDPQATTVPNVAWLSKDEQNERGLKKGVFLFYAVGDGTFYGLDTNQVDNNEALIVAWYIDSEAEEELDVVADDFASFIKDEVIEALG